MRFTIISSLLLAGLSGVLADDPSDVLSLTQDNFDSTVNPAELILVEFFAPWCGHCKALAPHYEEAATTLKERKIPVAKVDCVDQPDLCQKHGVTGYPTIKVFRNGTPTDYPGPRKADGIINYMVKQSLPAVTPITKEMHEGFKTADKVVVVLYATGTDGPAPTFSQAADKHREDYLFGQVSDAEVIEAAGLKAPALVVYKKFDEGKVEYPASSLSTLTLEGVSEWLQSVGTPLMDEVSGDNYASYAESGLPLAYLFVDPEDGAKDALIDSYKPLAKKFKGKVNFVWIDAVKFAEHGKAMNLQEAKWPAFVIQDMTKQLKYPHSQTEALSPDGAEKLVDLYLADKLQPSLKSEPIPTSQDEPVFVLVTDEFDKVVFDDDKDTLIEFYAPWCGHCKRLAPTWTQLGEKYSNIKDRMLIAKMDATTNDIPPSAQFHVSGFPTIKFKPAGTRDFIDYEGDRSLESLVEFITKHAKNPLDPETPFKGSSTSTKVEPPKQTEHADEHAQKHVEL
jgi:protein disulfide-isomerase A1